MSIDFTIKFQLSADHELLTVLKLLAVQFRMNGSDLAEIKGALMTQDQSIKALKDSNDAFKTKVSSALSNIAADEAAILVKVNTLSDLSPANQAVVDGIIADQTAVGNSIQALADSIPDEAPTEQP